MLAVTFASPIRGIQACRMILFGKGYRHRCVAFFVHSLHDIIALAIFPLFCLNPTGHQCYQWNNLVKELRNSFTYDYIDNFDLDDDEVKHGKIVCNIGLETLYKLPLTILAAIPCMMAPTVWHAAWKGFSYFRTQKSRVHEATIRVDTYESIFESEWEFTMYLAAHAIIDIWVAPFMFFAYLSPLRNAAMSSLSTRIQTERERETTQRIRVPNDWDYDYSSLYRIKAVKYGTLAIAGMCAFLHFYFHPKFKSICILILIKIVLTNS